MSAPQHPETRQCARTALIAIGANQPGRFGMPHETIITAMAILQSQGVIILSRSQFYASLAQGMPMQNRVLNGVILVRVNKSAVALLRLLKLIERNSGRSSVKMSRGRTLDLDIIAMGGECIGWHGRAFPRGRLPAGRLILPHARMHLRPFVLVPLAEIAPGWVHPALGVSAGKLVKRLRIPTQDLRPVELDSVG